MHNSFFLICLFQFSTRFKQPYAHHQEHQLYQYIWYVALSVGDCLVCRSGRNEFLPDLHTRRSPTQSDIYQMLYWYNWFSWWWARGCLKHVENWNKQMRKKNCVSSWLLTRIKFWVEWKLKKKNYHRLSCERHCSFYGCALHEALVTIVTEVSPHK